MGAMGNLHTFDSYYNPTGGDTFTPQILVERTWLHTILLLVMWKLFMSASVPGIPYGQSVGTIYRFYSSSIVDHLFKFGSNAPGGYYLEGAIGVAFTQNGSYRQPVYRFYNPSNGDHKYKTSSNTPSGYVYEGVAWYSPIPVYGCKDPNATRTIIHGQINQALDVPILYMDALIPMLVTTILVLQIMMVVVNTPIQLFL